MPFKREVIPLLDGISAKAKLAGAVNTIVNSEGVLTGYNTDVDAVTWALTDARIKPEARVLILGSGGMARACVAAVLSSRAKPIIVCRTPQSLADPNLTVIDWESRADITAAVLINATPIGMAPDTASIPFPVERLRHFQLVIDAVAMPPDSLLVREARSRGIAVVTGAELALRQALRQFELYTGASAPEAAMAAAFAVAGGFPA
jgi:shikimate dehydrogenase